MEALNKAQHAAAESLYKQAQSGGAGADRRLKGRRRSRPARNKRDVIDAEVVDDK